MADYAKMSDRELDAAVAEKVMGYQQHPCMADCWTHETFFNGFRQKHYFTPSTDIAAAWEVATKLGLSVLHDENTGRWQSRRYVSIRDECASPWLDLAPRAICLAAIAAVEAKEKTNG